MRGPPTRRGGPRYTRPTLRTFASQLHNQSFQQGTRGKLAGAFQSEVSFQEPIVDLIEPATAEVAQLLRCTKRLLTPAKKPAGSQHSRRDQRGTGS